VSDANAVAALTLTILSIGSLIVGASWKLWRLLDDRLGQSDERLDAHTAMEEPAIGRVEALVETALVESRDADARNVSSHIAIIEFTQADSDTPTTIFQFDGLVAEYHYIWGNDAWLAMVDLTVDEVEADLAWETVHPDDRPLLRSSAEHIAARKGRVIAEWRLVDAHTKADKGSVRAVSTFLDGAEPECWYYVAQYRLTP
jgi:PAS domain-containing protein